MVKIIKVSFINLALAEQKFIGRLAFHPEIDMPGNLKLAHCEIVFQIKVYLLVGTGFSALP